MIPKRGAKEDTSDELIASVLRRSESGTAVEQICRKLGELRARVLPVEEAVRGIGVPAIQRLKPLEDENSKPKKLMVDLTLDRKRGFGLIDFGCSGLRL